MTISVSEIHEIRVVKEPLSLYLHVESFIHTVAFNVLGTILPARLFFPAGL